MDVLWGLKDKLRFIEQFYAEASSSFVEKQRKISAEESPYEPPSFDPEYDMADEPAFLQEWQDADEAINLVGHSTLTLVQNALQDYLRGYIRRFGTKLDKEQGSWLAKYQEHFLNVYGIDWNAGPVPPDKLEEINLARNDIQHRGDYFGMKKYRSHEHIARFPKGIFSSLYEREWSTDSTFPYNPIEVRSESIAESIRRVEAFCEFLESRRPY